MVGKWSINRLRLRSPFKRNLYEDIFKNPNWNTWVKYIDDFNAKNPDKTTSIYSALKKHYTEDSLFAMIKEAKSRASTKGIGIKMEFDQYRGLLDDQLPAAEVFQLYRLDQTGNKIFNNPYWSTWIQYVNDFNKRYHDNTLEISTLKGFYSDEALLKILVEAKNVPAREKLAHKLQRQQFRSWLIDGESPGNVFHDTLKLDSTANPFESPLFDAWHAYLQYYNAKIPSKKTTVFRTLTDNFFAQSVWTMIQEAKKVSNTKDLATQLEASLLNKYLRQKWTPDLVADTLHLSTATADKAFLSKYTAAFKKIQD